MLNSTKIVLTVCSSCVVHLIKHILCYGTLTLCCMLTFLILGMNCPRLSTKCPSTKCPGTKCLSTKCPYPTLNIDNCF